MTGVQDSDDYIDIDSFLNNLQKKANDYEQKQKQPQSQTHQQASSTSSSSSINPGMGLGMDGMENFATNFQNTSSTNSHQIYEDFLRNPTFMQQNIGSGLSNLEQQGMLCSYYY